MPFDLTPIEMLDPTGGSPGQVPVIDPTGRFLSYGDVASGGAVVPAGLYETTPEAHGAVGDGTTDDTAAFVAAIAAIVANGGGILRLGAKTYLVNGALDTSQHGNAILALPSDSRVPIAIVGVQPTFQCDPRIDTGYSIVKTTKTGLTVGANGVPSILGGPTVDTHWVEDQVDIHNVQFWAPHDPTIAGVDLRYVRRMTWDGSNTVAINVGDSDFVQPTHVWAFGLRTPDSLNYNTVVIGKGAASGFYAGLVGTVESSTIVYWSSKWCIVGWGPGTGGHGAAILKMSLEWCKYPISGWSESAGFTSLPNSHSGDTKAVVAAVNVDFEDAAGTPWYATVEHIHDPTNKLYGRLQYNRTVSGVGPTTGLTVNGAANLVTDCLLAPSSGGVPTSRQVATGTGLSGGGDLSADRTLSIDTTSEAERIRDVIGATLVQGANITITVNDAGDTITIAAAAVSATVLRPLTTESGGVPDFIWDDNNELVMTEAPG